MSCSAYSGYANKKGMSEPALSQVLRVSYRSVITTAMLPEVELSEHTAHSDGRGTFWDMAFPLTTFHTQLHGNSWAFFKISVTLYTDIYVLVDTCNYSLIQIFIFNLKLSLELAGGLDWAQSVWTRDLPQVIYFGEPECWRPPVASPTADCALICFSTQVNWR